MSKQRGRIKSSFLPIDDSNARMIYVLVCERRYEGKVRSTITPKYDHLFIWFITITLVYYTYMHWQIGYSLMRFLLRGMKLIPVPAFQERGGQIVGHLSSERTCACSYRSPAATQWAEFSILRGERARAPRNHEWNPPLNARGVQLHNHTATLLLFISLQRRPSAKVGLIRQIRFPVLRRNRCHYDRSR